MLGLIAPGRNTVVETEMHAMAPAGVTINATRAPRHWRASSRNKQ